MDKFTKYLNREWRFCQQRFPDKNYAMDIFNKWKSQILENKKAVDAALHKGDRNDAD